ncbi:MAG: hydantoinase/oxoprolinase family protein [Rhizomicrobium sp.]
MKFVSRGDTTVADAYLSPVLARYTRRIAAALEGVRLSFMTSNGGLAAPDFFRGKDAIVSGPAGGVVGMAETARAAGFEHVIGFDMGGTSTDVARFDGDYERIYETEVAGVRLRTPMLAIHTVAAGGGSILSYDGARFRAGPDSAGAKPGPMSYRGGGPLTVTDANVMVGKLRGDFFPKIFGPGGDAALDEDAVRTAFGELAARAAKPAEAVADGFIRVAVENMANAIKRISVAKGYDARDYALACFGGAGGQHACLVRRRAGDDDGVHPRPVEPAVGLWHEAGAGPHGEAADDCDAAERSDGDHRPAYRRTGREGVGRPADAGRFRGHRADHPPAYSLRGQRHDPSSAREVIVGHTGNLRA